jgi:hypothetical protein
MRPQLLKRRYVLSMMMMLLLLLLFHHAYRDNNDCAYSFDLSLWFLFDVIDDIFDG